MDEEYEVIPLTLIPIESEDELVHDGVHPCGDPTCFCATYGYEVTVVESGITTN